MTIRSRRRFATQLVVAALLVAACSGSQSISDPKAIITKALDAASAATSVHVEATIGGKLDVDLAGSGTPSELSIDGTSLTGDFDIADGDAQLSLAVPAFLGLTADVIQIGSDSYVRTSLAPDSWQHSTVATSGLGVDLSGPTQALDAVKAWLETPDAAPTKGGDVTCDGTSCYQVTIELPASALANLAGPDVSLDPSTRVTVTLEIRKDNNHLATLKVDAGMGAQGAVTLEVSFSKWDASVSITAPPADQVTEGGGLTFP